MVLRTSIAALLVLMTFGSSGAFGFAEINFDREVRPILVARCFQCHGPDVSSRKAGLRLDDFEHATAARRDDGHAIVPFDAASSMLLARARHADLDERMPPLGHEPLSASEIETLTQWIEEGARYTPPRAFSPMTQPAVPRVKDVSWPRGALDRFVLAKMEASALRPSPDADPEILLRRLTFDLTGLPPSAALRARFVADHTDASLALIVDELLASPAFGERWARHWLDCVRYSETLGHEFDYGIPNAWRYRDWVIDAFNRDLPVSSFVAEQVAGDCIAPRSVDGMATNAAPIATAFWWMGQATHAPTDARQDEADRHANSIEVFGKAFLGLTVSCARCHDHKFDPIPTTDFYSLLGVLRSTQRVVGFTERDASRSDAVAAAERELAQLASGAGVTVPPQAQAQLYEAFAPTRTQEWSYAGWAFSPTQSILRQDGIADADSLDSGRLNAKLQGSARSNPFIVDARFVYARFRGTGGHLRVVVDNYWLDEANALLFESCIQRPSVEWRTATIDLRRFQGERAYIEIVDDGDGVIEVDWIARSNDAAPTDDVAPLIAASLDEAGVSSVRAIHESLMQSLERAPPIERTLEARDAFDGFDESVHLRGKSANYGAIVPRAALSFFAQSESEAAVSGSGREALARRMLEPEQPYVWRTLANRIAHHLLGRGIVRTTDDFGQLGRPPSHPELLDTLALQLQVHGSMKSLIREVVLSRTYRQSSDVSVDALRIDPENELFSRAMVRRLDGEAIRDAMLFASGSLDTRLGGPSVPVYLDEFMTGRGRPGASGPLDGASRRSVYLEVRRNFLDPFMQAFDAPVPSTTVGCRNRSNVPAQALAMLNDPLVHELARRFAAHVLSENASAADAIDSACVAAYGRRATDADQADIVAFLEQEQAAGRSYDDAWISLCHVLFNAKELTHLR